MLILITIVRFDIFFIFIKISLAIFFVLSYNIKRSVEKLNFYRFLSLKGNKKNQKKSKKVLDFLIRMLYYNRAVESDKQMIH